MKPLALIFCLGFAGCTSGAGVAWYSPGTWFSGSEGRAQAKAGKQVDTQRDGVLRAAHLTAHETVEAIGSAPASRPVEVAGESAQTTAALLDQALGALPVDELAAARARVADLLSENETVRAAAEKARKENRAQISALSQALDEARLKLVTTQTRLEEAFVRENAIANAHRNLIAKAWILGVVTIALGVGVLYLKFFGGDLAFSLGKRLARLDRDEPAKAEAARGVLDEFLPESLQKQIAQQAARTALRIKLA